MKKETKLKKLLGNRFMISCLAVFFALGTANAQVTTVSGVVKDLSGETIIGASVTIKGTAAGTVTDVNGIFKLDVPATGKVLVISYVGMTKQEMAITGNILNITLASSDNRLDELVVIGFGTVKKRDLTGSIVSIKEEDMVKTPRSNPLEAIQGQVPGLDITRSSGQAGAGVNLRIRGNRSITGNNDPLFIIDGMQGGSYENLNPNDIASIEVLKDASSTAIYGSQGANGVVLITTKKGVSGKPIVTYDGYFGVNGYVNYPKPRLGNDYLAFRREANRAIGKWSTPADDKNLFSVSSEYDALVAGQWVDWVDLLMQNGTEQSHNISIKSGNEHLSSYTSIGYFNEKGVVKNDVASKYTLRSNVDYTVSKYVKAGINSQLTYWDVDSRDGNALQKAATRLPLGVPYDENGNINIYPAGTSSYLSPLADERTSTSAINNTKRLNASAIAFLEIKPFKDLVFRSNFGTTFNFVRQGQFFDESSLSQEIVKYSKTSVSNSNSRFMNWDNILTYSKNIDKHSFKVTGLTSYTDKVAESFSEGGVKQLLASQTFYNLGSTDATSRIIGSSYTGERTLSFGGRLEYNYDGKYYLTASNRWDGSSMLSADNKWSAFPSLALAWRISDESFLKDNAAINNLKLRLSYGVAGNSGIGAYGTQSVIVNQNMGFGETAAPSYVFSNLLGNEKVGWENSATTNIGIDFSLLKSRINLTVDAYNTITSDVLLKRTIPSSLGATQIWQNIGETQSRGLEILLNTVNIQKNDFKWTSIFSFSTNHEEITSLIDGQDIITDERNALMIGHPINSYYTFVKEGIWQTSEADEAAKYSFGGKIFKPGDIKVKNLKDEAGKENVIDANNDRTYVGDATPKWIAGFMNSFSYKGFDLNVFLYARWGQTIDAEYLGAYSPDGELNSAASLNYWTPENPSNDFPRPTAGKKLYDYAGYQALNFVDGSFFKIKTISLGYTLPKKLTSKLMLSKLRVYTTGNNLFTFANNPLIRDYDPERGGSMQSPLTRQWVTGINIEF
ncbi:MAG: TonB-dependent receptor [Paludibacter sp.]|nr:TonB-dependent receptor [Paludibacter sp.]